MGELRSLHFVLDAEKGRMLLGPGLVVRHLVGDAARPDRLRLKMKVAFGQAIAEMQLLSVGDQEWLTNPLTGHWEKLPGRLFFIAVLEPDRGLPRLMSRVVDPVSQGTEQVGDSLTYRVKGRLSPSDITPMVGGTPAGEPVQAEAWVGVNDYLLRRVKLQGAITTLDEPGTTLDLQLSGFNSQSSIEPPS